jgi:ABC-type dipeptide/oligopeptide/nickel transport system permease component
LRNALLLTALARIATAAATLMVVAAIVFFVMRLIPGDPVLNWLGSNYDKADYDRLRALYGLDKPVLQQFFIWVERLFHGDLGASVLTNLSVVDELVRRIPVTVELIILALLVALPVGIGSGIWAAWRYGRPTDHALLTATLFGISLPEFFVGALLMLAFALQWRLFPATGFTRFAWSWEHFSHVILPALALGLPRAAVICRLMRGSLLEVFGRPFIRASLAKGLSRKATLLVHAVRNALIPVVTVIGLQIGYLVAGAVVVEKLFVIPGVGAYGLNAVFARDYPSVQGFILVVATIFLVANLIVDLLYVWLDPRIRIGPQAVAA